MEDVMLYMPELVQKITFLLCSDCKWKVNVFCEDREIDSTLKLTVFLN